LPNLPERNTSLSKRASDKKKRSKALIVWKRWGDWRKVVIALVTASFIAALLAIPLFPDKIVVHPGRPTPRDVTAPRTGVFVNQQQTESLRNLVAANVPRQYSTIVGVGAQSRRALLAFFEAAGRLSERKTEPLVEREAALRRMPPGYSATAASTALKLTAPQLEAARDEAVRLLDGVMADAVTQESLEQQRTSARNRASGLSIAPVARKFVGDVVAANTVPNRVYNDTETEIARREARDAVPPQVESVKRGDVLIPAGTTVTEEHMEKLRALGLVKPQIDVVTVLSLVFLAFGLVAVFCLYLFQFHAAVLRSFSSILLVSVVVVGALVLFRVSSTALGLRFSGDQLGFLATLSSALGAMLIAALLCPQIAVFVGVSLALLTSVMVGAELRFAILSVVSSLVGVQAVTQIRNRAGIIRAAVAVSAVNAVTAVVAHGATAQDLPDELGQTLLWAVICGFTSVLLFVMFAAWLERPFRVTTHLTLLELSDPSHPLLRRLAMEAPGTYSHSIIVGNLSEAAAEAIGADGLFCRVASYYHDVGKVIRPHFFVENQSSENRHNEINPSLSSLVVTSHVKDGVELAEEYKLPPPIISIIQEHHGTCLIKYFYHRAVTNSGDENTAGLEYQFRYEGPRPQTKESGVIMLADAAEASSRTLEKPTPGRIRDLIERIVRDRLSDGQLDECELTFKDLEKIISSMTRALVSLLHARIEYPAGDSSSLRKLATDGAANKEPVGSRKALADTPETAAGPYGRRPAV
jgi:cyclic-di-AMP phosphodiesterase PgpH